MSSSANLQSNKDLNQGKFHTSGPNLVVLAWLIARTSQKYCNFSFQSKSTPETTNIFKRVFYTYGPNEVIMAWTGPELSCEQTSD